jgi:phage tail sheath gpL-like
VAGRRCPAAKTNWPYQRTLILARAIGRAMARRRGCGVSSQAAASQFGAASQLAVEVTAYRANDPAIKLWTMPYSDAAASVAASGSAAFAGTATAPSHSASTACLSPRRSRQAIRARRQRLRSATMQATPNLPVTPTGSSGTLTLTAANKGTLSNSVPISMAYYGAHRGEADASLTHTITAMSGGGDPDLSGLTTAMDFDFIVSPWTSGAESAATTAMMNDTSGRWSYVCGETGRGGEPADVRRHLERSAPVSPGHLRQPHAGLCLGSGVRSRGSTADQARSRTAVADHPHPWHSWSEEKLFAWDNNQALLSNGIALPSVG